jgi:predicted transcriptional regulator of viral defense system
MRVEKTIGKPNIRNFVSGLAAGGRYFFGSRDARSALGVSPAAAKLALNRLTKRGAIASPARGFYVIVPPEYQSLGCLPADQFIPALMKSLGQTYYAGLLSAAQYHGAAHHRPQEFQIFLAKNRRPIQCGTVRVAFMARKRIADVPVQSFNTPRGTILVSTPEATAIDLVGYQHHAGGLDQVATILSELVEKIDPEKLAAAAATAPIPWAQRLGYLLEHIDAGQKASALKVYVRAHARLAAVLLPSAPRVDSRRDDDWNLYVNADVEAEI